MNENEDCIKRFVVMGVVKGAHYSLSWNNGNSEITQDSAYELMLTWKNSFNDNKPFLFSARIGETVDIIRTDTIEKMYIKHWLTQKDSPPVIKPKPLLDSAKV
jgi:hypothetical protein